MILRIVYSLILLISILFLPFYISLILAIGGIFLFPIFWESMVLFLISDLFFGISENRFLNIVFLSFILITLILIMVEFLKKKLKFYSN